MKKIIFVILLMTASGGSILAQGGGPGGRQFDPARVVQAEKQLLLDSISGLNDDQKLIIEAIYTDYLNAFTAGRENADPDNRTAMREEMLRIRNEKNDALEAILTEEQYTSFSELLAKRREAMRQRRQGRNE